MTATHFDLDDARSDRIAEQRERREAERALAQAFTPVDELPKRKSGLNNRPIPPSRQVMFDYCLAHPGQWVRYTPTPDQDRLKPHSMATMAKKQQGGFPKDFEVIVRDKVAYIRFTGGAS